MLLLAGAPLAVQAVTPSAGEFAACRHWAEQMVGAAKPAQAASLKVVYEDTNDGLSRGRSWRGTPFQLGDKTYTHGLAFNSTKHILVRLGQPGSAWWANVGNWAVKQDLYPAGFKPLSDALRKSGRELMLWFEPERVRKNAPWHQGHGDWLIDPGQDNLLWNLGRPEARMFLTEFLSSRVDEFGLGCYRQDFNMDPLPYWQAADAPDRQGITEIPYIEGLYAFWDGLLKRHPGLIIDMVSLNSQRRVRASQAAGANLTVAPRAKPDQP
ncbi:MAG TPA: alpha-galactosidase [Candidatus Paceibacterota bacterium]|nr:alpha-galactosidase [Verrucomicrobiota bacterium]HSA11822.1 alpha-galactosidase [Candidatus Paceibacterota bacterium]